MIEGVQETATDRLSLTETQHQERLSSGMDIPTVAPSEGQSFADFEDRRTEDEGNVFWGFLRPDPQAGQVMTGRRQ